MTCYRALVVLTLSIAALASAALAEQKPTEWYRANPQFIPPQIQNAMAKREQLVRLARIYAEARSPADDAKFAETKNLIDQIDNDIVVMQGNQGVLEFEQLDDPRRLNTIMTHFLGVTVAVQPRDDGKFNIVKIMGEGKTSTIAKDLSRDEVIGRARALFDPAWRR